MLSPVFSVFSEGEYFIPDPQFIRPSRVEGRGLAAVLTHHHSCKRLLILHAKQLLKHGNWSSVTWRIIKCRKLRRTTCTRLVTNNVWFSDPDNSKQKQTIVQHRTMGGMQDSWMGLKPTLVGGTWAAGMPHKSIPMPIRDNKDQECDVSCACAPC